MRTLGPKASRRGVALLIVMLLLATLSVLMVAIVDDMLYGIRRTANVSARAQIGWHALGLEALARQAIYRAWLAEPEISTKESLWARRRLEFALDQGVVSGVVRDAGKCFNLNSVATGPPQALAANPIGAAQFEALLAALEIRPAEAAELVGALTDWIDANATPERFGAEDYQYALQDPSYRTAGGPIADVTELRAIKGYSETLYRRLRPFVCALPITDLAPINVNMLAPGDAPLVRMLGGEDMTEGEALRVIADAPAGGWRDPAAFWAHEAFAGKEIAEDVRASVALRTRYYELRADISYLGAFMEYSALIELEPDGRLRSLTRRFGAAD